MGRPHVPSRLYLVRCLGPNPKEHTFKTPDPVSRRVCDRCKELQRQTSNIRECTARGDQ